MLLMRTITLEGSISEKACYSIGLIKSCKNAARKAIP